VAFGIVDSILARTEKYGMQDSDKYLFRRALALCAFVDDPAKGIAKMREAIEKRRLVAHELREIVTALGESRSDVAVDFLLELASNQQTVEQCEDNFFNALAALDTPRARDLLLGLIDPDLRGIALPRRPRREDVLVARITELARREPKVAMRLRELCERELPDLNRHVLSKVMDWLGTPEALASSLNLIDDSKGRGAVPQGIWDQIDNAFVERRPYGGSGNVFTQHARASNELRSRLFRMVTKDKKRHKSAFNLLGQIEERRLEHGRPTDEPRHPDFRSGEPWPPIEPA
jgi:NACHT conflict system protein